MHPLKIGDFAAILNAGAYGASMSSHYNTRPLAAEVMVKGDKFFLIRKTQTIEDIIGADIIPGWLT
jgi:diaminopimelate decarboxylase